MDECPWCGKELDAEEIWIHGDLNNDGYYECPGCGGLFTINQYFVYSYEIEMGPAIKEVKG